MTGGAPVIAVLVAQRQRMVGVRTCQQDAEDAHGEHTEQHQRGLHLSHLALQRLVGLVGETAGDLGIGQGMLLHMHCPLWILEWTAKAVGGMKKAVFSPV